ncbi:MAG: hypothetical protein QXN71_01840 [Candidatus Aenigmatarchaeota archaeon]
MAKNKDFVEESIERIIEFINEERMYNSNEPVYLLGRVSAESRVPHGTDTDYVMKLFLSNRFGKKQTGFKRPVMLPNDEEETRDGPAYMCRKITENLGGMRIMNTLLKVEKTSPYTFEIKER